MENAEINARVLANPVVTVAAFNAKIGSKASCYRFMT